MRGHALVGVLSVLGLSISAIAPCRAEIFEAIVINSAGQPAAAAKVTAAAIFRNPPLRLTTQTDGAGRFRLELPQLSGSERYAIAIRWHQEGADATEGLDGAGKTVEFLGQKLPKQSLQLCSAGSLTGSLRQAEDDAPIAGAQLFLDTGEVLTTDDAGRFELQGLAMRDHSLIPVAPSRIREYVLFDTSLTPDASLDIRLPLGSVLRGRITDENGEPIPGAYLTRASSGTALTLNGWAQMAAADGTYEYGGLSTERLFYSLQVHAPGFESTELNTETDDHTAVLQRNIKLERASVAQSEALGKSTAGEQVEGVELPRRTLHGVILSVFGEPILGAKVRWGDLQSDDSDTIAFSDAFGKYQLANAPSRDGAVFVLAAGYAPQFAPAREGVENLDVSLQPGVAVRGRVINRSGKPIAGVYIVPRTRGMWISERSARTSASGAFEVTHVAPGTTFDFLKDGHSEQRDVVLSLKSDNEITLVAGGAIHGRVVDASGNPVTDFKVRVMIPRERSPDETVGGTYAGYDWYGIRFTRPDGRFIISDVPAGALMRLIATSPEHGVAIIDRAVTSSLDELLVANDVLLRLAPHRALNVNVTGAATGKPLVGSLVSLLEDEPALSQGHFSWDYNDLWASRTRTDSAGKAHFASPLCEDGTIVVRASGFARRRLQWTGENRELSVALDPGATVLGEVRVGDALLSDGYVQLQTHLQDFLSVDLAESGGKFEFTELPLGDCTLTVSAGNKPLHLQRLVLKAGENPKLQITVPAK